MIWWNDSHEFKPILSEIEDRPVSPLGRFIFWTVVAMVVFSVLWLTLGEVDVVVTGRGKVVPQGQVKLMQPLDTGVITAIRVREGQEVRQGDVLMEIDPATTEPGLTASVENLAYAELESQRIEAMLAGQAFFPDSSKFSAEAIRTQRTLYRSGMQGYRSQLSAKRQELAQLEEQIAAVEDNRHQVREVLALSEANYNRLLPVRDLIAKQEFESAEKDRLTLRHQKQTVDFKLAEMQHHQEQLETEIRLIQDDFRKTLLTDLSEREKSRIEFEAKTREIGFHHKKQQILSPVNGVVDQLFIHTIGGVVTPAEKLLTVVPKEAVLEIEAQIDNRDVGFVHAGQPCTIKVDTFDFQKYGTLPGVVSQVSSDSRALEEEKGAAARSVYTVRVAPEKLALKVDGKMQSIRPGMNVMAEVKVGNRRIIEFFIYPLIKSLDESFKLR